DEAVELIQNELLATVLPCSRVALAYIDIRCMQRAVLFQLEPALQQASIRSPVDIVDAGSRSGHAAHQTQQQQTDSSAESAQTMARAGSEWQHRHGCHHQGRATCHSMRGPPGHGTVCTCQTRYSSTSRHSVVLVRSPLDQCSVSVHCCRATVASGSSTSVVPALQTSLACGWSACCRPSSERHWRMTV